MPDDARERERERRRQAPPEPDRGRELQRKFDLVEAAKTPGGRRIFRRWLFAHREMAYQGRQDDVFNLGLRTPGVEFEKELRAALPRELFLEVIYPEKEE